MKIISFFGKVLIISILNIFVINTVYAQIPIGQTEVTKWQYGKKGAVSITYDDGTINQFRVALPIMNRLELPGTFYINTGTLPGSKYTGRFIGRPVSRIIEETKTIPTNRDNVFERASAARYLGFRGTGTYFTRAGAAIDANRYEEAYQILDDLYQRVVNGEFQPEEPRSNRPVNTENVLTWDMVRTYAAQGHEFASHMVTHPYMSALDERNIKFELEKSRDEIKRQVGFRHTFSTELPYGTTDARALRYALNVYPAARNGIHKPYILELHRPNRNTPVNSDYEYVMWERGAITRTTLEQMNAWVDTTAMQDNIWYVLVLHGIDGIGWEPLTGETVDAHFTYIKSKEDDLWVATFADAARYVLQRMNAKVDVSVRGENINVKVNHPFNKKLYDIPLTLKTYVNPEWREAHVKQGRAVTRLDVRREGNDAYVMYQAMPGKGTIVISNAVR
jgi:peptidoglycan/xylan/chitin deacetylase (PgdA/CDA1 family)